MPRDHNAQLAVNMFNQLASLHGWSKTDAWKGIAILLLTCKIWRSGWANFHDVVVYKESNTFTVTPSGPNATVKRGMDLSDYLAFELRVTRADLCNFIGQYWLDPAVSNLQPNNLVGHAFRSIVVDILERYGNPAITYQEEVDPYDEFPGYTFHMRSKKPRIDIIARKGGLTVAILSTRWRYRHDRVDLVDESLAYIQPARRAYNNCGFFGVIGECSPARIEKVLDHCPPKDPHGSINAAVHFNPELITKGLKENGRMAHLKSLLWLIDETFTW
jgi:hypothetical protein